MALWSKSKTSFSLVCVEGTWIHGWWVHRWMCCWEVESCQKRPWSKGFVFLLAPLFLLLSVYHDAISFLPPDPDTKPFLLWSRPTTDWKCEPKQAAPPSSRGCWEFSTGNNKVAETATNPPTLWRRNKEVPPVSQSQMPNLLVTSPWTS